MKPSTDKLLLQFKALADPIRVRLVALCAVVECSVSELTQITGQSQPRVSQHLKQLCSVELLERFRDGHFVYYRVTTAGGDHGAHRGVLSLLPEDEPQFARDVSKLRLLRGGEDLPSPVVSGHDRSLHRALVELTVSRPLGDLLDIGCGQGRILKLLASRAKRSVGVDVDSNARRLARAELLLAGTPNCTLRQGDMYSLPFEDREFDTVVVDDVLRDARDAGAVLKEASRLLKSGGRMLLLASVGQRDVDDIRKRLAVWASESQLRLASPRSVPSKNPGWLLAVATPADRAIAAA